MRFAKHHTERVEVGVEGNLDFFDREAPASDNAELSKLVNSIVEGLMTSASPECLMRLQ